MTDELALHKDVDRAAKAKSLLESELMVEILASLDAEYIRMWKSTQPRDTDGREKAWFAMVALTDLKGRLFRIVDNGAVAQAELDDLLKLSTK